MPPVKDFRELKLKSQVIDSIFLFLFIETVAMTGYTGNQVAAFFTDSQNIAYYRVSGQMITCCFQRHQHYRFRGARKATEPLRCWYSRTKWFQRLEEMDDLTG
jgi:hypothetical protein